jgi:hypothetical protein
VYNFTGRTVRGEAPTFALPDGWSCEAAVNALEVAPGERAQWSFTLKTGAVPAEPATESWTKLSVDCGGAGRPVAAFRVRLIKPNGEAQ